MATLKVDPRDFISSPYIACPKCGEERFGILLITGDSYLRRCKSCLYPKPNDPPANFTLPELNKKIVYLDQFAISNMMKSLNRETKASRKDSLDLLWFELFERLDRLCKMQVIVCPSSSFHTDESLLSPYYRALKDMYSLLSNGVSFHPSVQIKIKQVSENCESWFKSEKIPKYDFNPESVTYGDINQWSPKLIITVNLNYPEDMISNIREVRGQAHDQFAEVFRRWQNEKGRSIEDWFEEERNSLGEGIVKAYFDHLNRVKEIRAGDQQLTLNDLYPDSSVHIIEVIRVLCAKNRITEVDHIPKIREYLSSPYFRDIPFVKISSMLFASLARKAATGRKKPPSRGMLNDVKMISVLLPYCDAMFIDNECRGLLAENPLNKLLDYKTNLFSLSNKEKFFEYLDEIETDVSMNHVKKLNEVYGSGWKVAFTSLYDINNN